MDRPEYSPRPCFGPVGLLLLRDSVSVYGYVRRIARLCDQRAQPAADAGQISKSAGSTGRLALDERVASVGSRRTSSPAGSKRPDSPGLLTWPERARVRGAHPSPQCPMARGGRCGPGAARRSNGDLGAGRVSSPVRQAFRAWRVGSLAEQGVFQGRPGTPRPAPLARVMHRAPCRVAHAFATRLAADGPEYRC